jgi:hypothetical protein
MSAKRDGAKTLQQHLELIVSQERLEDLEVQFHGAVKPVAKKLLDSGNSFTLVELQKLESSAEIAAVTAGVHLRSLDVCAFWKPLLAQTSMGSSHAAIADLKAVSAEARALMALLEPRPSSEMRDKVMQLATEAAARTEKWIPDGRKKKGGGPSASRYGRGTFHDKFDADGSPIVREVTRRKIIRPESGLARFIAWTLTLGVLGLMGYGVYWVVQNNQPDPMTTNDYSVLVRTVQERTVEDTEAVLRMGPGWIEQKSRYRESDIRLMLTIARREALDSVRMVDGTGAMLGHLKASGALHWGPAAEAADERRAEQDRLLEEFEDAQRNSKRLLEGR